MLLKDRIHQSLEGRQDVRESEGHDNKLTMNLMSTEDRFMDVGCSHAYLVITRSQNFENTESPCNLSSNSSTNRIENLSLTVRSFYRL